MKGHPGSQAQEVVKGQVKGAQRRRGAFGELDQLVERIFGVQGTQVPRAVAAGAAGADNVF